MSVSKQKVKLCINSMGLQDIENNIESKLYDFFQLEFDSRHIIFKRGVIYFYSNDKIIETLVCKVDNSEKNIYTFDGVKVTRTTPQYYVGSALFSDAGFSVDLSSNNNNNNNNNNGNNNG